MQSSATSATQIQAPSKGNRKMSVVSGIKQQFIRDPSVPASPYGSSRRTSIATGSKQIQPGYGRRLTLIGLQNQRGGASNDEWDKYGRKLGAPKQENTYHMEPQPHGKFNSCTAQRVMEDLLEHHLGDEDYDQHRSRSWSENLADTMVQLIKDQGFSRRYKYVCFVTIGQKKSSHAMQICSRCLWTANTDNYASVTYAKKDLFAVAVMFATYME